MDFFFVLDSFFSFPLFASSSLTDYFMQSNFAGKAIVVILLIFSVLAWGIMFCKNADLSAMKAFNARTMRKLKESNILDASASKSLEGPYAVLLRESVKAWTKVGLGSSNDDKSARIAFVENTLQRSLSRQILKYNSKMTLLGTIISGAPFLGLLGTAWGVMDCFGSMSAQTSVTLQMLAPGVAGALLTTVAGLVVAIPSVIGYNFLTEKSSELSVDTENFASLLADTIEIESRQHSESNESAAVKMPPRSVPIQATRVAPKVDVKSPEPKIINFSLDDDDDEDVIPPRHYEE